jgi:hypothetical protein
VPKKTRAHPVILAAQAQGDGAALDLPPSVLAERLLEGETLAGRLDLVLDRLASATDNVGVQH